MSNATMIVTVTPNPAEATAMQDYSAKAGPILAAAGGTPVKRMKVDKAVIGEARFAMVIVMEFPDASGIEAAFASDEYQALIPLRDKAFERFDVAIAQDF